MKKRKLNELPVRGRWKRVLSIGLCSCISISIFANGLKSQVNLSQNNATLIKQVQKQEGFKVKGKVIDKDGPLVGVYVMVKGSMIGNITDRDGNYEIMAPYSKASLVFSYVGYQPQEIKLDEKSVVDVTMVEDSKALEEVVVVGYATQKKATVTGSVSTITTKDLKQSPTANLNNALAGRLPGLMANQFSGGEPGVDAATINIRGISTYGDQSPIVIVDGVERNMSYLAPEEIETFTILKDASATALYGIRGANGVIVVNTKRGKASEKPSVSFKASRINSGASTTSSDLFSQEVIENFKKAKGDNSDGLGYNWDYFDYAFKPGIQQDYSLSIRGGSERARYYVMANSYQQDGNYKHTNLSQYNTQAVFKRYNFRTNIDVDITKNFYVKVDLGARITDRNAPGTTASRVVAICNTQPPYLPITLSDNGNSANQTYSLNNPKGMLYGDEQHRFNLLGELSRTGYLDEKNTYLNGSFAMGHKLDFITKGLKIEGTFSYDAQEGRWIQRSLSTRGSGYANYGRYATFQPSESVYGSHYLHSTEDYTGAYVLGNPWYSTDETIGNSLSHNAAQSKAYYQLKLDYARTFDKHDVTALFLFNRSDRTYDNAVNYRYQGLCGRLTYSYDNKYLAEFDAGYNGSENFAPGKRYGFFPAGSIGWVISRESFMEGTKNWLNSLKIRSSLGLVGSDMLGGSDRFAYLQYYVGGSGYSFGDNYFGSGYSGIQEGSLANPNLTWEKSRKFNIGLDASLLHNKLTVSVDFFKEHRYDIITNLSGSNKLGYPDVVGKGAAYINSGIVNNHGIDLELGWNGRIGKNFSYYIKPNLTYARNKIIFMNEIDYGIESRQNTGKRVGEHFVYIFDHFVYDQAEADKLNKMNDGNGFQPWGTVKPGDCVYKDMNGDGKIDNYGDRVASGYPRTPEIQYGIPFGAQYKGIDLSILLQGSMHSSVMLSDAAVWDFPSYEQDQYGKVKAMHLNHWTEETKETATYPRLTYGSYENNKNSNSSLFLYNADYLRVKTIEVGYDMPKNLIKFAGFQKVRFYAQGLNLITFDNLDEVDVDPETKEGSGDWYPIQKVFNFGVEINF
ncbi:MAG: TonB-linked outer membrane protein, SusC/RagA family [Bacteroidetes bacterium]|nr:TonB-linked outer membrane protein, SusC/RagA family [Bacteroidota bacterium]